MHHYRWLSPAVVYSPSLLYADRSRAIRVHLACAFTVVVGFRRVLNVECVAGKEVH
jgi:hypothetical protein